MDTLTGLWNRLRVVFRRDQIDRGLEEEMRFHVEMETRHNLEAGMPEAEARRAAHLAFGSRALAGEDSRQAWSFGLLETLLQDVRYGARTLIPGEPLQGSSLRQGLVISQVALSLLLLTVATMAAYGPARRASRLDPVRALRCE